MVPVPSPTAPAARPPRVVGPERSPLLRAVGWVLLSGWLVVVVGWFFSPAPASYHELRAAVADGEVGRVEVAGRLDDAPGVRGYATVTLTWEQGWTTYRTQVVESRPLRDAPGLGQDGPTGVTRDLGRDLRSDDPDVEIVEVPDPAGDGFGVTVTVLDREIGSGWGAVALVTMIGQLLLLVRGPLPWRATRWAWFWIGFLVPPVGGILFLLLSGATLHVPPRQGARKLTGGWAFLLALVLGGSGSGASRW